MNNTSFPTPGPRLGLQPGELRHSSLAGLVRAIATKDEPELRKYRELSDATEAIVGPRMAAQTYLVPADLLVPPMRRDMTVGGAEGGGPYLIGTQNLGFGDTMAAASILSRLPGVQTHYELKNDATITRGIARPTAMWLASDGASPVVPSDPTLGQVSLTPKTCMAMTTCTRGLLLHGGALADQVLNYMLATALAEAADAALLTGSGTSGQPHGLFTTGLVDSRAGTSFALSDAAAMLKNADGWVGDSAAWVAGIDAAEDLRQRPKVSGGERMLLEDDRLLGRPLIVSRSAPDAGLIVAPWAGLHFASWGALELAVDGFTAFTQGLVSIRVLWRTDFAHESPGQIAVATALT
jgi:HK97 family phage major capsid protein